MPKSSGYDLHCPTCRKKADTANPMYIRYSARHLQLPIFLCSPCRTIYIDKPTVRQIIREWRNDGLFTRKMPLKKLYQEFLGELEGLVKGEFVSRLGYKQARFFKQFTRPKP